MSSTARSRLRGFIKAFHTKQPSLERRPARTSSVRALIAAADAFHGIGLARLFALLSPVSRTPWAATRTRKSKRPPRLGAAFFFKAPGSDLLSHGLSHTTIGAGAFHCRVRDGIGWDHAAVSAREAVLQVALLRLACIRTWDVTYDELSHGVDAC